MCAYYMELQSLLEPRLNQLVLEARLNGLWRVLKYTSVFGAPSIRDESSHGPHDAGGIFIPGPYMFMEAGGKRIASHIPQTEKMSLAQFDSQIIQGLETDCASLIYPSEVKTSVSIPSFYEQLAPQLLDASYLDAYDAALSDSRYANSSLATLLLMPDYVQPQNAIGRKVKATSALSIGLSQNTLNAVELLSQAAAHRKVPMSEEEIKKAYGEALKPVFADDGTLLYKPSIVVLHATRHGEHVLSGLTRFLNYDGNDSQFQTLTFEDYDSQVKTEFESQTGKPLSKDYIVASYDGVRAVCVLRNYTWRNGGAHIRPQSSAMQVLHPSEFPFSVSDVGQKAKDEYQIRHPIYEGFRQIGKGISHMFK
jgi:hypothetical protein